MLSIREIRGIEDWARRAGPWVAALVTPLVVWWTWAAVSPLPIIHDEASYVLQAEIFARFRWTAPAPPIPEFFEQPYVLVTPVVASMFAPGHALLLALGALLHFPPLVPLLLSACTAALIMVLLRRVANVWVAWLAWLIWLTTPLVLRYQPGYFSETTTTTALLLSWWGLLRWRESRAPRWLVLVAAALAWGGITRPVTMLAYGIPIAVVVVRDVVRGGGAMWRQAALAAAVGAAVLGIIPLWSARTTGNVRSLPLLVYTRDYIPFNKPGFVADTSPPRRALPPVMQSIYADFLGYHKRHTLSNLPTIAMERLASISRDLWGGTQVALVPFFVLGLFASGRALRFAAVSALLLFGTYLTYAYDAPWTIYYLELTTVVAAITATGLWRAITFATSRSADAAIAGRRAALAALLVGIAAAALAVPRVNLWRAKHALINQIRARFEEAIESLPASKSIVFVHYSTRWFHLSIVLNSPDLARERVWVVHDMGARNARLLALEPDRTPFLFDEETLTFTRYPR